MISPRCSTRRKRTASVQLPRWKSSVAPFPNPRACSASSGVHPVLARVFAARGIATANELDRDLATLARFRDDEGHRRRGGAACRCDRAPREDRGRRRLRCRRRHGVRRGDARTREHGRRRRLPRAQPLRIRLRSHARDRRRSGPDGAAPHRDRRPRHREPRRRRGGGGRRHRSAGDRSPSARRARSRPPR